jgi:hypothetical protein
MIGQLWHVSHQEQPPTDTHKRTAILRTAFQRTAFQRIDITGKPPQDSRYRTANWTATAGHTGQDSHGRTGMAGQPQQGSYDRTATKTATKVQPTQGNHVRIAKQDSTVQILRYSKGQSPQHSRQRTATIGQL